jgi:hypothetical protein
MQRIFTIAATAYFFGSLALAISAGPAAAQKQISIAYEEPKTAKLRPVAAKLKKFEALETLQKFLAPLKFPLTVKTAECGGPYAPYQPGSPVTICYEYVDLIDSVLPGEKPVKSPDKSIPDLFGDLGRIGPVLVTRNMATAGPFVQQALHEVAVAVLDKLEIPVWGRLDDAADYLSAFLMLQFGTDVARKTISGTAYFLNELDNITRERLKDENYLGDVRPTLRQRYYNVLCIAVGRDPIGFSSFLAIGRNENAMDLPAQRAINCRGSYMDSDRPGDRSDYSKVRDAFNELILPELDQKVLKEVQNTRWLVDD